MYFDDCQQPAELKRAISEFMKIQTGRRVNLAGKESVAVPLIDEHTDQTLREGVAEAYAAARKMLKTYQTLPNVPAPSVVPLESLVKLSEWCDRAMRQMPEKAAATERNTTHAKRRGVITCLKKVVEKAWQIFTKSFWESVLERVWPK